MAFQYFRSFLSLNEMIVFCLVLVAPLCWIRRVRYFVYSSFIGNISVFIAIAWIMYLALYGLFVKSPVQSVNEIQSMALSPDDSAAYHAVYGKHVVHSHALAATTQDVQSTGTTVPLQTTMSLAELDYGADGSLYSWTDTAAA